MAYKTTTTLAFFLAINLIFFTMVSACGDCPKPKPKPKPKPACPPPPKAPTPTPPKPTHPTPPKAPTPTPKPTHPTPPKAPTPTPKPTHPTPPKAPTPTPPKPTPPSAPTPPKASCPSDTLKLGVCGDLLGGLISAVIGTPSKTPCCSLIQGLADLDAAVCLCTAIKANVLGINLNIPLSLTLLLNVCDKKAPEGFKCE